MLTDANSSGSLEKGSLHNEFLALGRLAEATGKTLIISQQEESDTVWA